MPKSEMGYVGALFQLGVVLGFLVLPRVSDKLGRKTVMLLGNSLQFLSTIPIFFTSNFNLLLVCMFLSGFGVSGRLVIGYVWMSDFLPPNHVKVITAIIFFFGALALLFASLFFYYVSKEWKHLVVVCLIPQALSILLACFAHESPKYYCDSRQFEKARSVLSRIG